MTQQSRMPPQRITEHDDCITTRSHRLAANRITQAQNKNEQKSAILRLRTETPFGVLTSLALAFLILVDDTSVSVGGWCVSIPANRSSVSSLTPNPIPSYDMLYKVRRGRVRATIKKWTEIRKS